MPTVGLCALQRAYLELRERGEEDKIIALTALLNDHEVSTRVAAYTAREQFGVTLSHNNFTTHRNGVCSACNRVQDDGLDPTRPKVRKGSHHPSFPKKKDRNQPTAEDLAEAAGAAKANMRHDQDGNVIIKDVPLYQPLLIDDDLSPLLTQFGLDPTRYEVVRDTFSMWMQSASDGIGGRDVVYLYAAKFRRVGQIEPGIANADQIKQWRSVLLKTKKAAKPTFKPEDGTVGTYALWPSDLQLGKTRTAEAVQNFQNGIKDGLSEASRLISTGVPIEGIHIGWGGDETEGVCNNYKNQAHTIELNLSEQLELDTDLRIWAIKEALATGLPLSLSSTISNHGEWTRNGSKDVETTKSDNASTHVARQVKRLFDEIEPHTGNKIDWTIGKARGAMPGLVVNISGEKVYTSHGHIEKGRGGSTELRTKGAIENQLLGDMLAERRLLDVRMFVMAHYHHFYTLEDRGRIIMGLPALEAERSSEYMASMFGVWSPPGMVGMVIGKFDHRPYRHLNIFGTKVPRVEKLRGEGDIPSFRVA